MKHIKLSSAKFIFLIPALALLVFACKKDYLSKAVITVVDVPGKPISGATVILHAKDASTTPTGNQEYFGDTAITDEAGKASFSFNYEAIYTVEASKIDTTSGDSIKGITRVKLEEGSTVNETVTIQ